MLLFMNEKLYPSIKLIECGPVLGHRILGSHQSFECSDALSGPPRFCHSDSDLNVAYFCNIWQNNEIKQKERKKMRGGGICL